MLCATLLRALDSAVCHLLLVQFQYYVEPHLQNHMRIVQTHAHTSKMMYFNLRHVLIHHYKPATCSRVLLAWVWVRVRVCAFVWISKAIVVIREWAPAFRYSNCLCHFHLKREPTRKENTQTRARSLTLMCLWSFWHVSREERGTNQWYALASASVQKFKR